jgi:hypothetical protein
LFSCNYKISVVLNSIKPDEASYPDLASYDFNYHHLESFAQTVFELAEVDLNVQKKASDSWPGEQKMP